MKRQNLFALIACLGITYVAAENISLSGTVVQSNLAYGSVTSGTPISGVAVNFPRLGLNATTTAQGTFSIVYADVAVLPAGIQLQGNVLDLQNGTAKSLSISAVNAQGQKVNLMERAQFAGRVDLNALLESQPMGLYVLSVQYGSSRAQLKMRKVEQASLDLKTSHQSLVATDSLVFTKTGYKRQAIAIPAANANLGYVPMMSSVATVSSSSATPISSSGKAVRLAYLYTDNATEVARIDWTRYTHVGVFTTLAPQDDGSIYRYASYGNVAISNGVWDAGSSFKQKYVNELKAQGIKALLVVGGAGSPSSQFDTICKKTARQDTMVKQLIEMVKGTWVQANGSVVNDVPFDGVDVDYEFPVTVAQKTCLNNIMTKLKAGLPGKLVTVANSYSTGYYDVPGLIKAGVDWIGVMSYDYSTSTNPNHSPYGSTVGSVNNYITAGAPANKLLMGIGMYGKNGTTTYEWKNYYNDASKAQYFTSKDSTLAKADFVISKGLAGVMYWEVTQDAYGTTSAISGWVDDRLKASSK